MNPMVWNDLPDIQDAAGLDESDERCLEEIRTVVLKHGKSSRFGAVLLHRHFQLGDDELLVEHCDEVTRTLTTKPTSSDEVIERDYTPTVWRFDGAAPSACSYCPRDAGGTHNGYKEPC